ncbi:DUF6843 domain-containing protein [Sinomicrobium sp.]
MNFKIRILVLFVFLTSMLVGCRRGEHAIFVVPENYTGYILVIYDQENGSDIEYWNKSRVYRIPSNGILLSKFSNNPGWSGFPKFYRGSMAPENEIPFIPESKNIPEDRISASGGVAGGSNRDYEGKVVVRYVKFFVGNRSQIKQSYKESEGLDIIKLVDER